MTPKVQAIATYHPSVHTNLLVDAGAPTVLSVPRLFLRAVIPLLVELKEVEPEVALVGSGEVTSVVSPIMMKA
jgi:hypothetical protein